MTQDPSRSGQDPIGEFQRWLFRSGARGLSREVSDQVRSVLGRSGGPADVWARATAPPADEAPECAWCPFCRAARMLRESGPGQAPSGTVWADAAAQDDPAGEPGPAEEPDPPAPPEGPPDEPDDRG